MCEKEVPIPALFFQTLQKGVESRLGNGLILIGMTGTAANASHDMIVEEDR